MGKRRFINDSIDYILQHLDGNLSVKDVADHFNYSEFYFSQSVQGSNRRKCLRLHQTSENGSKRH